MPAYPHIETYHDRLRELIEFGGSDNELNISPAFQGCLDAYCRDHRDKLVLVPQLRTKPGIIPDGTVRDSLRMARGYWEAKDSHDDLDAEIQKKFNAGYPRDNIVFEDSRTAVLFQNRQETMRADMARPRELHRLIRRFLEYELPNIEEFKKAREEFKNDLPSILENLRQAVDEAAASSEEYQATAADFLKLCHSTISPHLEDADVREMLLQHILTKDIFLNVFREDQFHEENNISRKLEALENTFFKGDLRREAVSRLRSYYGAIGRAAYDITDHAEKQQFLKAVYGDFYRAYNPKAADRLGVVYTPNEIVDFIIRGADHLLQKHFGRALADDRVQILDPAAGTGTFVTSLINYLPPERLEYKYRNEIRANEVAILPYYIANLNIAHTYQERMGRYLELPNFCFVDTLDNMDWQGAAKGAVERQGRFVGGLSEENLKRVQEQNRQDISVIIGNPPYNANQRNENENNKNREYPAVDQRISGTYIAASTAQKTKQYDMYKRFIRWAADRLSDDGIIAFITNRAYIDSRQDDGFRKVMPDEFSDLYIVDLGGDIRKKGKVGNVFGIMTGVAVGFFVRRSGRKSAGQVHYYALEDEQSGADKLAALQQLNVADLDFQEIKPDSAGNWLNQSSTGFEELPLPIASRQAKLAKSAQEEKAVFSLYSMGVVTNRDEWVYDFAPDRLGKKVRGFIREYEEIRAKHGGKEVDDAALGTTIKWTRDLKRQLKLDSPNAFNRRNIRRTLFRPFVTKSLYFDQNLNEMQYQLPDVFPTGSVGENKAICFCVNGKDFYALASDRVFDLHFTGDTQCLPLYRYTAEGERVSNITDWGLQQFREHYRDDALSAEDIFAYTYAVLHDPVYRYDYAADLLREFPRLPFYADFGNWAAMGRELLALHLGFETAEPYPLERRDNEKAPAGGGKVILKADKEKGLIRLDEQTTLAGIPESAWRYVLGSRSALEWVLDQYKERKPKDAAIAAKFNAYRFADYKDSVIDLLQRVCAVSVGTMAVVDDMAYWLDGRLVVFGDRDRQEWSQLGLAALFSRPPDSYDDPENQAWLGSLPDLGAGE